MYSGTARLGDGRRQISLLGRFIQLGRLRSEQHHIQVIVEHVSQRQTDANWSSQSALDVSNQSGQRAELES